MTTLTRAGLAALLVLCFAAVTGTAAGAVGPPEGPSVVPAGGAPPPGSGTITINDFVRAIDGDTIEVRIDDDPVGVGLIGIDAPEGNTPCGQRAWDKLQALVAGGARLVEQNGMAFDRRYRRMYHVHGPGGRLLAAQMVRAGLARATGQGRYHRLLAVAQANARKAKRGCLWSGKATRPQPAAAPAQSTRDLAAATLPGGFTESVVASGLSNPTAFALAPDGRIFVAEKGGVVKVVSTSGIVSTVIDLSAKVNTYWDRGLIGLALDPGFASNGYLYLLYTYENNANDYSGFKTGRLARYTVVGNTASLATEQVILGSLVGAGCGSFGAGSDCMPSENPSHSVGNIAFASDGTMFVTSGDGASFNVVDDLALRAQNVDWLGGKILHITSTGAGVPSNPFWNGNANAVRSKVWAYGFRNPFRLNLRPTGVPYVGDVGWQNWEEIDVATAGSNFGWPCYEGVGQQAGYAPKPTCQTLYGQGASAVKLPLVTYNHAGGGAAVVAGIFYTASAFPAQYQGAYFYGDYVHGWIRTLTVDAANNLTSGPTDFAPTGGDGPVDFEVGADGAIYYSAIRTGQLRRITYGGASAPPSGTSYVSDLSWTSATNGFGPAETNRSNGESAAGDGNVITLNGATYQKGLGVHAVSSVKYYLGGACQTFQADVGVDDEVAANGLVQFKVFGDGAQLFDSGNMSGTSATQSVNVDVTGRAELELSVGDGGNGKGYDHADWANARITCGGGSDMTPPTVIQKSPAAGATGVATNVSPTVTFSEPMQSSTVNGTTVTLVNQATQAGVPASVTYDSPTRTATLDPNADLASGTTYVATVKSGANGVKDVAGNQLAQDYTWSFATGTGAATTSFLSDLTWTSATNGWGPVEKDMSVGGNQAGDGTTLRLNGTAYQKGLGAHAVSSIHYDLGTACQTFQADVGVDDEVAANGSVQFKVVTDGAQRFDSGTMTGTTATKTVSVDVTGVNDLELSVGDTGNGKGSDHADWANARVTCTGTPNLPPVPTITMPSPGLLVSVDDVVQYSGSATDPEDGQIPAAKLSWQVTTQHCTDGLCHPHDLASGPGTGGSFTAPDHADDVHWDVTLTATDSDGRSASTTVRVDPRLVQITIATSPSGLQVVYGGETGTSPMTVSAMVGGTRTIFTPSPQGTAQFSSWSDAGAQQHNITIGSSNATYTAAFTGGGPVTTYLSDMTWTSATNGWGPVERDRSNREQPAGDGNPITLNGVVYPKGLGVHALSDITFDLAGACSSLQASVGVDDEVAANGSVIFRVYGDGALIYDSLVMTGATATKTVNVSLTGITTLRLNVDPNGVKGYDHADWADARVTC